MAEAVFAHLVKEAGLKNEIEVDSAGTGSWHIGEPAHNGTRRILKEQAIEYSGRARQIVPGDLAAFDYIITMDNENFMNVRALERQAQNTKAQVFPLLDFSPIAKQNNIREVPDPYYGGGFDVVYRLVLAGCSGLLEHIRRERNI